MSFTLPVTQPGNEGNIYRFKVVAENGLGEGLYSEEVQLMAVDEPDEPTITAVDSSRTQTSIRLNFAPGALDGGSDIIGYKLYRDYGVSGSPFTLLYDGANRPEIITYLATGLETGLLYSFKLFSLNAVFESASAGTISVRVGTVPSQPLKPI